MAAYKVVVSIVIPVRNEERYIADCLESLLIQTYPRNKMEWIVVDGCSTDQTADIVRKYVKQYPNLVRIVENPNKTVPYAMNLGIQKSVGEYIVRLDAHAAYERNYISKCVEVLIKTGAENVGGVAKTEGRGFVGGAIAKMLSSKFGVGNSQFRTSGKDGYVDTVPFGAFKREVFEKWGGYDERLTRNQDNEMNFRIRKNGGKIFMSNDIKLTYFCRDTIRGIISMARSNGMWNIITMYLCPGSMGVRHFVPFVFFISIIVLPLLGLAWSPFFVIFAIELMLYLILDIYFSLKESANFKEALLLLILFPLFHMSYGLGSFFGLIKLATGQYRREVSGRTLFATKS